MQQRETSDVVLKLWQVCENVADATANDRHPERPGEVEPDIVSRQIEQPFWLPDSRPHDCDSPFHDSDAGLGGVRQGFPTDEDIAK